MNVEYNVVHTHQTKSYIHPTYRYSVQKRKSRRSRRLFTPMLQARTPLPLYIQLNPVLWIWRQKSREIVHVPSPCLHSLRYTGQRPYGKKWYCSSKVDLTADWFFQAGFNHRIIITADLGNRLNSFEWLRLRL